MRIIILGGSGFIGSALTRSLLADGAAVTVVSRNPAKTIAGFGGAVTACGWGAELVKALEGADGVVNLAGEEIAGMWTKDKKRRILESRVKAGESLVQALGEVRSRPRALIQASAVGYYGAHPDDRELDEGSPSGQGFLAQVCREWEASTRPAEDLGVRRAVIRTGIVLGLGGGILGRMLPAFRAFLGGYPGSGRQMVSWIHVDDEVRAIRHLIESPDLEGPFNLTAPAPCTMREFCSALGSAVGRPSWLPIPAAVLRAALGEAAEEMVLFGQRVAPKRLLASKFSFRFADVTSAFKNLFSA